MNTFLEKVKKDLPFYIILALFLTILSFFSSFRDMVADEALYFHETYLLSELFRSGTWLGPYGVGIHGFLFKIPPALVFLLTGPSVEVVTIYNILLTLLVVIVSFKLFSNILKNKTYGILSSILLLTNFHFFTSSITYLREVPSILVILLLLNHIIQKGKEKNIILSILFLLLLDVKEYIFAVFVLFYVIWLFIDSDERIFLKRVWHVIKQSFIVFLPSLIWTILMFTTNIIPVNMFWASIIGLKDNTFGYLVAHLDVETATFNALEGGRDIFRISIQDTWHPVVVFSATIINTILSYIGKVMYPRVFSFLSVPKVVILPVVVSCIITLKRFIFTKGKEVKKKVRKDLRNYALLSTLILIWLVVYIVRASHGRYLLPIVPAIALIYVYFLFKQRLSIKQKKIIFIATLIYVSFGIYFETTFLLPKILLEFGALTLFLTVFLKPHLNYVKYVLIALIASGSMASAILFSYVQGQIYGAMNFGVNRSAKEIAQILPDEGSYWINSPRNQSLISAYNNETYLSPEWKWRLHEIVPIRDSLKVLEQQRSYTFRVSDIDTFKENIEKYEIEKVFMIVTQQDFESYPDQDYMFAFIVQPWLEFDRKEEFQGLDVFIFEVVK